MSFSSQMIPFFTAWTYPKQQTCNTHDEKCHNVLSSSISTTRWRYNQGKCILAYTLCRTFKNLISPCSVKWIFFFFFLQIRQMFQTYFSNSSQAISLIFTKLCTTAPNFSNNTKRVSAHTWVRDIKPPLASWAPFQGPSKGNYLTACICIINCKAIWGPLGYRTMTE